MFVVAWRCHTASYGYGMEDDIGGSMKEIMMEYGAAMIGIVGTIGFLILMQDMILGDTGLLSVLLSIAVTGGI